MYPADTALFTLNDAHGALLAEYFHYPAESLLVVRWHGHLTAADVVRGARAELELQVQHRYTCLLNDKSATTGDWSEALPLVVYEWLPLAKANNLKALAYLFPTEWAAHMASEAFVGAVRPHLAVALFSAPEAALQWLKGISDTAA